MHIFDLKFHTMTIMIDSNFDIMKMIVSLIAVKDTQPHINNSIVHHIICFSYTLLFTLIFVVHAWLEFCSFLNFNAIMFATATHVFDKACIDMSNIIMIVSLNLNHYRNNQ